MDNQVFKFLNELKENNDREWFAENKAQFEAAKKDAEQLFKAIQTELMRIDEFSPVKMYRIYRDVRFSSDKSPYKTNFGAVFMRKQPHNRGSFYVQIEPGASFVGGGFWGPNKDDLLRIRKAIEMEDDLANVLENPVLKKNFGGLFGEALKTAPKGFDKEHPRVDLLRYKQFLLKQDFPDSDVLSTDFVQQVVQSYQTMQPFFHYMTDVLTTDENGESIL